MKRSLLFASLLVLLGAVSCTKENINDPDAPGGNDSGSAIVITSEEAERLPLLSDNFAVTHEQAEDYARSLVTALNRTGNGTKAFTAVAVIDSIVAETPATKSNVQPAKVYVVDMGNGQGYVLTPGDRRVPEKILGYSDEGSFAEGVDIPAFAYAMECLTDYVAYEIERVEGLRGDSIYMALCGKLGLDNSSAATKNWGDDHINEYASVRIVPNGDTWTELTMIGPLLTTRWSQSHPFNWVLRQQKGNYPVGCVATAVAQIMNYHKRGTYNGHTYQWANFTSYGVDTEDALMDLGQLFVDLGLPSNLNMQYNVDGSGAYSTDVPRTFAAFGYTCGNVSSVSGNAINSNIADGMPVYASGANKLGGGAHAWVIDGSEGWHTYQNYTIYYNDRDDRLVHQEVETREEGYPSYGGAHCNWGWGGSGDTWLSISAFKPFGYPDKDYSKDNQVIYNIRPR